MLLEAVSTFAVVILSVVGVFSVVESLGDFFKV